jgi:hypothetical protein
MVTTMRTAALISVGVLTGLAFDHVPGAFAQTNQAAVDITHKIFGVSITEIKKNVVFLEEFAGTYTNTVTLSDGSTRVVELTPMIHNGMQVVELNDSGHVTYMALNGTTTNGSLMIQLRDMAEMHRQLREQGWKLPN